MDEDVLNMGIRKFLKKVGINGQRTIEQAVRKAVEDGRLADGDSVRVSVQLEVHGLAEPLRVEDELSLV